MKIVLTSKEILAALNLINVVADECKFISTIKADELITTIKGHRAEIEAILNSTDAAEKVDLAKALTETIKGQDPMTKYYFSLNTSNGDLELIAEHDADKLVAIMDVISGEVGTLAGLAITAFGLLRTFGKTLNRMGERIAAIATK